MDTSKFLSKVIGLYEIIISLAMLLNMQQFSTDIQAFVNNGSLMIFTGCITVILGLLMVVSHNIWQWHWRIMVTIVGWIVLLKGLSILLFPHALDSVTMEFINNSNVAYTAAVLELLLGMLFCYFGFRRS